MSGIGALRVGPAAAGLALICAVLMPAVAGAWPWSKDMANQISIKPQHGPDAIRPFPQRSVPMVDTTSASGNIYGAAGAGMILIHVHDRDGAMTLVNPNPATEESIKHG